MSAGVPSLSREQVIELLGIDLDPKALDQLDATGELRPVDRIRNLYAARHVGKYFARLIALARTAPRSPRSEITTGEIAEEFRAATRRRR